MDRHHPPITLLLDISPLRHLEENRPAKKNFFRGNYKELNKSIKDIDWKSELCNLPIDESVCRFYDLLADLLESIPTTRNAIKNYPCWFTKDLILTLKCKVRARCKYLRNNDPPDLTNFKNLRKEFKAL